jgi:hypothetical protein
LILIFFFFFFFFIVALTQVNSVSNRRTSTGLSHVRDRDRDCCTTSNPSPIVATAIPMSSQHNTNIIPASIISNPIMATTLSPNENVEMSEINLSQQSNSSEQHLSSNSSISVSESESVSGSDSGSGSGSSSDSSFTPISNNKNDFSTLITPNPVDKKKKKFPKLIHLMKLFRNFHKLVEKSTQL